MYDTDVLHVGRSVIIVVVVVVFFPRINNLQTYFFPSADPSINLQLLWTIGIIQGVPNHVGNISESDS